jgi:sigma-54 dependent transcriptional regulator, flagellar regulatory protein
MGISEEFVHLKCDCPANQYLMQSFSMLEIGIKSIESSTATIDPDRSYAICEHVLSTHAKAFAKLTAARIICAYQVARPTTDNPIHFLRYPFSIYDFKHVLLFLSREDTNENEEMKLLTKELVGSSTAIKNIRLLIRQVANSDSNVLILGESGTGKEVIASCIHQLSSKRSFPFVPLNCGAIPSELIESELFGHEKGAFTGAASKRIGRFEIANHGTLFLDEIGDMPLNMQVKLLRVLQERKIERVGSTKSIDIDVKIISATNKNLEDMITQGTFREDLYYRINVIPIFVPTVRDRADDIPLLINSLMERISKRIVNNTLFSDEAIQSMCHYSWPGNIRELANFIERMVVICHDRVVTKNDVAEQLNKIKSRHHALPLPSDLSNFNLKEYLANIEQQIINNALEKANGIVSSAAEYLNLRRTTLIEKMKKYQLITNE